ncbi:hypothetical protein [Thalassotalea agarivorans]|uniref:Lipoprotein n=1 Tax=Thalassotalea agarivorans TaxID=349064 RepID=A0A1I0H4L3_THASX|nr:hypothetical protein [Thalassotalea agarivorans]SET78530.1 hypothetical protein SAMN05660429_02683 [Thalassotalea agarivorans]
MKLLKVTGLVSFGLLSLSACGESTKTKDELSKLSIDEYAVNVCQAFVDGNIDQLRLMYDAKLFERVEKKITPDLKWYVKRQEKLGECVITKSKKYSRLEGHPQKYGIEINGVKILIQEADNGHFTVTKLG